VVCHAQASTPSPATPAAPPSADPADLAVERQPDEAPLLTDEIVVTAGRSEQRIQDLPVKVTLVMAEEIEASPAQAVDDLLSKLPSFNIQRTRSSRFAPTAANQSVAFRGLGGNSASRALVLVDGVPLNEPFAGWLNWSRIPLFSIERIEVLGGGGATAWGNQALGGVIQVITRRPEPASVAVAAQYGSGSTSDANVGASDVRGPWAYAGWVHHFRSDGYYSVPAEFRGPIDRKDAPETRVIDGRLEHTGASGDRWTVQANDLEDDRTGDEPLAVAALDLGSLRVGWDSVGDGGGIWRANLFGLRRRESVYRGRIDSDRTTSTPLRDQFDVPSDSLGGSLGSTRAIGSSHLVSAGLDALWTDSEVHEDTQFAPESGFTRRLASGGRQALVGAYLQDNAVLSPRVRLAAGLRVDRWRSSEGFFSATDLVDGELLSDQELPARTEEVWSPSLGIRFNATQAMQLRAAAFQSFRAPSPNELFKSSPLTRNFLAANNELDPERVVLGLETGFDYLPSRALLLRATGFWNEVEDLITDVTVGRAVSAPEVIPPCGLIRAGARCDQRGNLDEARTRGVELDFQVRTSRFVELGARYTYTDAKVVRATLAPELEGLWIRRIPEHQYSLEAGYRNSEVLSATVLGRYLGERFQEDRNTELVSDSFQVDLHLSRRLTPRLDGYVTVENVFDEEIETQYGEDFSEVGQPRWVHVGVRYKWRAR
jgi:outer membrane receptor protein involved in Fe transport